ncbi:RagB/SusD family nutrient uptake outer membrane protein [Parabacteroides sp.]
MKKILTIAIACAGLMTFPACSDFLDESPKSSLTYKDYYKTQGHIEGNVNYMYREGATRSIANFESAYMGSFAMVQGYLTGYFSNPYEGQEPTCKYSRLLTRQENTVTVSGVTEGVWKDCYKIINVANGSINSIPNIKMDEEVAKRLMGEAKFFRAFNYFMLVKTFGDVPLYTTFYSSADADMMLLRSSAASVYELIESDLKEAVESLPAVKFADNAHRITKYAAAMLLTDVYMYQNKYADAAQTAKIVINSPHKLVANDDLEMGSAYNKLRTTDDLDEAIFVREANATISTNNWLPTYSVTSSFLELKDVKYAITERIYGPSDRFLNIYDKNDLRRQPNQFFHWEYTQASSGKKWSDKNAGCWYWFDEDALLSSGRGTKDWNFYRYAEALLDGAEAIAHTSGVTAEAAGYLAQIKARANMEGKTVEAITVELQSMGKDAFIQECWRERLREMPLEFKIWDDCVRTKMFPVVSETTPGKIDFVPLVGATNAAGATFTENDLLWPVATTEIQRNPNLTQNEGYSMN